MGKIEKLEYDSSWEKVFNALLNQSKDCQCGFEKKYFVVNSLFKSCDKNGKEIYTFKYNCLCGISYEMKVESDHFIRKLLNE